MKVSRYNFFFQDGKGDHYAFNGLSGGLLELSEGDRQRIEGTLTQINNIEAEKEKEVEPELLEPLLRGRFVLDDEIDELEILKARNRMVRFSGNELFLTIVPTHSCNFRCTYCFQDHQADDMSCEVQRLLINFVRASIKSCKGLHIHWYGGEPLLCFQMIRDLSIQFKEICKASNCRYSASMTTNGSLLKEEIAAELSRLGVGCIQITLDGPPETHNKRRPSANGQSTFEVVLNNLAAIAGHIPVVLRINIDPDNVAEIPGLLDILQSKGLGKEVLCEFVPVAPLSTSCHNSCFSTVANSELWNTIRNLSQEALNRGLGLSLPSMTIARHCNFDDVNSFMIETDGSMYKCSGDAQSIGQLDSTDPKGFKLDYFTWVKWTAKDPFAIPEGRECQILPQCMGGCAFKGQTFGNESRCPVWKDHLAEFILLNVASGVKEPI